jgi:acetyl-CoA C-acetyltransferase
MGQLLTAGAGQIPARQAAVAAGIPMDVPAVTVSKVCLSGIDAIALVDLLIRAGEFDVVVAGGQVSMTLAPHLLAKSRQGFKFGDVTLLDHIALDALFCTFDQVAMGASTEKYNSRYQLTRAEQDEFSARSHQRAAAATRNGIFVEEIVPVQIPQRRGDPVLGDTDEDIRGETTAQSLGALRPFSSVGTITAGSSSQISDATAAVVVMSKAKAQELGLTWLADVGAHGVLARPDAGLHQQPANAISKACAKGGITPADLDLVEINEAFAAVGLVSTHTLGVDPEKVNGGAIAVGHPIGMSGARIVLHLAAAPRRWRRRCRDMRRRPGRRAGAAGSRCDRLTVPIAVGLEE